MIWMWMNVNARNDCKLARTTNTRKTSMNNWRNYSRIDEVLHEAERLTVLKHHGSRNPSRTRSRAPFNGENRFSNFPEASARVVTVLNSLFTTAINILPQITIRSESLFSLVQLYSVSSFKIISYDWSRSNMSARKRAMKPYNWHLRDFYRLSKKSSVTIYMASLGVKILLAYFILFSVFIYLFYLHFLCIVWKEI